MLFQIEESMVPFGEEARLGSTDRWLRVASGREEWAQPRGRFCILSPPACFSLSSLSVKTGLIMLVPRLLPEI